ncbi:F0F1 ATP synthase subunit delta [Aciditerrimonas ferrireducens]|uniref:F0F1 ATP synthase subunit delta n=1 Tax=Aciditerrimonas ferrireducens TaxID=667306 RepID=UPI002003A4CB|nr:F0F1 ATP synthase subunit delta [Aciditerrimonas ferrireducens]MCK4176334.1 F0F1 ATP synthase subunit delta [Aciditerrimonas ferrireducens]
MDLATRGYTLTVCRQGSEDVARRLADELAQVSELVEGQADLAMAVSDVAVALPARRAILQDLFAERVAPATWRVVRFTVETERAPELLSALLAVVELVRLQAERPEEVEAQDDRPLGHGALRRLLRGVAAAAFEEVEDAETLREVEDELFRFARIVEAHGELRRALRDHGVPARGRVALVRSLLAERAHPATVTVVGEAVRLRLRDAVGVLDWLAERAAEARGWRIGRVTAAREVDADEQRALAAALEQLTGRPVELQVTLDPALLGGARVEIGDLLVDATTAHRLAEVGERLRVPEGAVRAAFEAAGRPGAGRPTGGPSGRALGQEGSERG